MNITNQYFRRICDRMKRKYIIYVTNKIIIFGLQGLSLIEFRDNSDTCVGW